MGNSENPQFPYKIGDIIEIDAPSLLQRRAGKVEHKLHVAAIKLFDRIVSSDEYHDKRFALVTANPKGYWADKVVTAHPLSPRSIRRGWNTVPLTYVIKPTDHNACGLDGDYVVAPMQLNVRTPWIKKKIGFIETEFLSAFPYTQQNQ